MTAQAPTWKEARFAASGVKSLVWQHGDRLVDWAAGGGSWAADGGAHVDSKMLLGFPFDGAISLPDSDYAAIFTKFGTKALLFEDGKLLRELNRSYYMAPAFEYPISLFRLASGRAVVAHCPEAYNRLRIDDLASGEVLAVASERAVDFFHSRLRASPDGRFLASAGWHWHPIDEVRLVDVEAALRDPATLDACGTSVDAMRYGTSAVFDAQGRLLVSLVGEGFDDVLAEDVPEESSSAVLRIIEPARPHEFRDWPFEPAGALMPVGAQHVLTLHGHPRLYAFESGELVHEWPGIAVQAPCSATPSKSDQSVFALDIANARIAIAHDDAVTVLSFEILQKAST